MIKNIKTVFSISLAKSIGMAAIVIALSSGASNTFAGPVMYVHDSAGELGTVDVATGNVILIGNMGVTMTDIAFSPTGDLFGLSFSGLYSINLKTAAASFIGNHSIAGGNALVFSSDGTLYGAGNSTTLLYSISTLTGDSTSLGNMGFASGGDLAFKDGNLFLASSGNQLVKIDLGNLTNTSAVGNFGISDVFGLATGSDNTLYAVAGTTVYQVNTSTGAATSPVSFTGQGLGTAYGQSFITEACSVNCNPNPVPTPATLALLSIGLTVLGFARRRKFAQ